MLGIKFRALWSAAFLRGVKSGDEDMAINLSKDGNVVRRSLPLFRAGPPGPLVRDDDDTAEGYSPSSLNITDELQNRNPVSEVFCLTNWCTACRRFTQDSLLVHFLYALGSTLKFSFVVCVNPSK